MDGRVVISPPVDSWQLDREHAWLIKQAFTGGAQVVIVPVHDKQLVEEARALYIFFGPMSEKNWNNVVQLARKTFTMKDYVAIFAHKASRLKGSLEQTPSDENFNRLMFISFGREQPTMHEISSHIEQILDEVS